MKNATVYKLIFKTSGKFYIGSSKEIKRRFKRHLKDLENNRHHCIELQKCFNEYGKDDLELIILQDNLDREEAFELEDKLLKENKNNPLMMNISLGSKFGDSLTRHPNRENIISNRVASQSKTISEMSSEERSAIWGRTGKNNSNYKTGKFISENHCEVCGTSITPGATRCPHCVDRNGEKNSFFGRHHSEETRKVISEKVKGRVPANCVGCYIDGKEYSSLAEASRQLNIPVPTILWRCNSENFPNYHKL